MTTMRTSNAFLLSATLHGSIIALILLLSFATSGQNRNMPHVLELVAGDGNNYGATRAPALGTADRVKLTIPTPPAAEPAPVEPAPVQPAPTPPKPAAPAAPKAPNFSSQIRHQVIRAESTAKMQLAREHAAEAKRLAKEEADRAKQAKAAAIAAATAAATPPKFIKIDATGIAKGVVGGSTENKIGGAGGKALVSEDGNALERYFSLLKRRLEEELNRPPGLSDSLVVTVEFRIAADGTLSAARVVKRSGSAEFDRAALDAIASVRSIGARPDGKSETLTLDFRMSETDSG